MTIRVLGTKLQERPKAGLSFPLSLSRIMWLVTTTATPRSRARVFSSWASCIIKAKPGGGEGEREGSGASGTGLARDGTPELGDKVMSLTLGSVTSLTFPLLTSQKWGNHSGD